MVPVLVLLMSFGTPQSVEEIPDFLTRIRRTPPPEHLVKDLANRYDRVGGSPLIPITKRQAHALETACAKQAPDLDITVAIGMKYSEPYISETVRSLDLTPETLVIPFPLAPQFAPDRSSYKDALLEGFVGKPKPHIADPKPWHLNPIFTAALTQRTVQSIAEAANFGKHVHVLFTAHSLPMSMPGTSLYMDQLNETAASIVQQGALDPECCSVVFQSIPTYATSPWLTPDLYTSLDAIPAGDAAVVVPIQFLCDHLEVLFDIDVLAFERAKEHGVYITRIPMLNDDPELIDALCAVVLETIQHAGVGFA